MNPIYLSMKAFGSYKNFTEIDFERAGQNLFLITGPTGSGKSTIFDAIVFALYGEVSASEGKKDSTLQSEFAPKGEKPEVIFEFSPSIGERDQVYRIRRVPHYRKRKGRKTAKGGEFTPGSPELSVTRPDGTEISGTITQVQQALNELVGLTKEQFMQVVMIAQGEFIRVLREDTVKKTEIFRKLFHTEVYEQIVEELGRRKGQMQKTLEATRGDCDGAIDRIRYPEVSDRDKNGPELASEIRRLASGADYPGCIELLENMCERMSRRLSELEEECRKRTEQAGESAERFAKAEGLTENFKVYEAAEQMLRQFSVQEEEYKEKDRLLKRLEEAFHLLPKKQAYEEEIQRLRANRSACESAKERVVPLEQEKLAAKQEKEHREQVRFHVQREYQETAEQVKRFLTVLGAMEKHLQAYDHASEGFEKDLRRWERLEADLTKAAEGQCRWQQIQKEKKDAGIHMEKAEQAVLETERLKKQLEAVESGKTVLHQALKKREKACQAYIDARQLYQEASEKADRLDLAFLDNQAGVLAHSLKDGEACKVCGSTVHPKLAVWDEKTDVSQQGVRAAKEEKEKLHIVLEKKKESLVKRRQDWENEKKGLIQKIGELRGELKAGKRPEEVCLGIADRTRNQERDSLEEAVFIESVDQEIRNLAGILSEKEGQALQMKQAAVTETGELEEAEQRLAQLEKQAEEDAKMKTELERRLNEWKEIIAAKQAAMDELTPQLRYNNKEEAATVLEKAERAASQSQAAYEQAEAKLIRAEKNVTDNQSRIQSLEIEIARGEVDAKQKEEAYQAALTKQKQVEEEEIVNLTDVYSWEEVERLRKAIRLRNEERQRQQGSLEAAKKAIGAQEKPDMEQLKNEKEEKERQAAAVRKQHDTLFHICEQDLRELEKLKAAYGQRADMYRSFRKVEWLYNAASGARSQGQKNRISLETYVQRVYLKQVLTAANRRFEKMTMGAYRLELIDIEAMGAQSQRGLDLAVRSMLTGNVRDISTLSGGESFMAALSMALGLADQIKVSSSAIRLDMMFIDEGFGSLDDHTRNQAVAILKELAGKDRKIGIISHVSELRQSIEDQIVVRKGGDGSEAEWG